MMAPESLWAKSRVPAAAQRSEAFAGADRPSCCLRMAADSTLPLAKAQFEDLAQTWLRLANDLERQGDRRALG